MPRVRFKFVQSTGSAFQPFQAERRYFKIGLAWLGVVAASTLLAHTALYAADDSVTRGARIFSANCARCHGSHGKVDGPDLVKLQSAVSPDDWTDKETNRELTDSFIISMITKGGKANGKSHVMPAFGDKLSAHQVDDLLAFIRSLAK